MGYGKKDFSNQKGRIYMRTMGKTNLITCQLSFYPLNTNDTTTIIEEVLDNIRMAGLDTQTNDMATIIKGERHRVMELLNSLQDMINNKGCNYTMVITISNICGCSI